MQVKKTIKPRLLKYLIDLGQQMKLMLHYNQEINSISISKSTYGYGNNFLAIKHHQLTSSNIYAFQKLIISSIAFSIYYYLIYGDFMIMYQHSNPKKIIQHHPNTQMNHIIQMSTAQFYAAHRIYLRKNILHSSSNNYRTSSPNSNTHLIQHKYHLQPLNPVFYNIKLANSHNNTLLDSSMILRVASITLTSTA